MLVQFWTKNPPVRVEAAQIEQSDQNKQDSYQVWSQFEDCIALKQAALDRYNAREMK